MKRKLISLVAVLALALSLTACGGGDTSTPSGSGDGGGSTEAVNLAFAFMGAEDTMVGRWATSFKEKVEAASEGGITVTLYPNGELGSDSETIESLLDNTLQIVGTQPSPAVPFVPELAIFDLPCAFATADAETINTVLNDSDFATQLDGYFAEANLKCLGFSQGATFREFSSNTKITDLADFNGLKMRVMDNAYQIQFWGLMGCSTTPVPGSELYMSLQNGLVEAQENALDSIIAGSMDEVQDYITMTNPLPVHQHDADEPGVLQLPAPGVSGHRRDRRGRDSHRDDPALYRGRRDRPGRAGGLRSGVHRADRRAVRPDPGDRPARL